MPKARKGNIEETSKLITLLPSVKIRRALEAGDTRGFPALMHQHWIRKKERSLGISNEHINRWCEIGLKHGALAGKLIGASGGGFLIFYAEDRNRLREVMARERLTEVKFLFDFEGSKIFVNQD